MKQVHFLFTSIVTAVLLSGCATTSQPKEAVKPANSLKEYIAQQRAQDIQYSYDFYNVIAESEKQSLIEYRTFGESVAGATARDVMEVLDDLKGYCEQIGGQSIYGDQAIKTLNGLPTALSLDYVSYTSTMKKQGNGKFEGFYQCLSPKDGFNVTMRSNLELQQGTILGNKRDIKQTFSRYYLVDHDKTQPMGLKTWLSNPKYAAFASKTPTVGTFFQETSFPWKYEPIMKSYQYCTYHGGQFTIQSPMMQFKEVSMDEYLLARMEALKASKSINVFMDKETFTCKDTKENQHDFSLQHQGQTIVWKR